MPDVLNPQGIACARCGCVAEGHAEIDGERYCHGDGRRPSCYELESEERAIHRAFREYGEQDALGYWHIRPR